MQLIYYWGKQLTLFKPSATLPSNCETTLLPMKKKQTKEMLRTTLVYGKNNMIKLTVNSSVKITQSTNVQTMKNIRGYCIIHIFL